MAGYDIVSHWLLAFRYKLLIACCDLVIFIFILTCRVRVWEPIYVLRWISIGRIATMFGCGKVSDWSCRWLQGFRLPIFGN